MVITKFHIQISKENVCRMIHADPGSSLYEEIMTELAEMLPLAYEKIKPAALLEFGDFDEYSRMVEEEGIVEALYGINTVGDEIGKWSTALFQEGNYLAGMLADAMADDYLFQMDEAIKDTVIHLCKERKRGIVRRVEAPADIPMTIQKKAFEVTGAQKAGIGIKESYMYDPVKTVCQVYLLDRDTSRFYAEHDCSRCDNVNCMMRNIPVVHITVRNKEQKRRIKGRKKETLLETLRKEGVFLSAVCAGRGSCGKCRIRVLDGSVPETEADLKFFSNEELAAGYRLACRAYPESDCTILIEEDEKEGFFVQADGKDKDVLPPDKGREYGIAVDIGTTTIAMQLVELATGKIADVYTALNRQRAYGADVISRIEAANGGKKDELTVMIREILKEGTLKLTQDGNIQVERMVIGGNTTMIHLLMGYSCETLGVYPFLPVNIDTIHTTQKELLGKAEHGSADFEITVYPGISTYVGGDIVAGLYALGFADQDKVSVLIDLGTNGELAIGNKDRILVASTAAGPAFEGGNIVCGMGSIPGAVCKVEMEKGNIKTETIGKEEPKGICGTGVIDCVYELIKEGIVDETGLMEDPYFESGVGLSKDGKIRFYQKDVREIQLAKSAVRAGLETLILRYGIVWDEIERVYVAGGFGHKLDIHKAVGIGLFPSSLEEKVRAVGNSCLRGVVKYLTESGAAKDTSRLAGLAKEVNLSNDKDFQEFYMEYMGYEP